MDLKKTFLCTVVGVFLSIFGPTFAHAATYYFNNAVDTNPTTLGNYWNDVDATDPATSLPDFTTDEVSILDSATFDGDITFNGTAVNAGTITGNAVFNGEDTQNNGTVLGTKTRHYTSSISTARDFISDGPWIVIADRVDVDITGAVYDATDIFRQVHGGSFTANYAVYFFNNNVNTDPVELGNYCMDYRCSTPASTLPVIGIDQITVVGGATFTGDAFFTHEAENNGTVTGTAIFYDISNNTGTVSGDATFVGDQAEQAGVVDGTAIRQYSFDTTTTRDFISTGPWTVIADGAVVDIQNASYDNTTTRTTQNGGSFILPVAPVVTKLYSYENGTIVISYDTPLNLGSVPDTSDFTIKLNGESIPLTNIAVNSSDVTLTIGRTISGADMLTVSYTPGVNPIKGSAGIDAASITDRYVVYVIAVTGMPANPFFIALGNKLYTVCGGALCIIDTTTDTLTGSIAIGTNLYPRIKNIGNYIYIGNSVNKVSVVNTITGTVVAVVTVGSSPTHMAVFGTKLYVSCSTSTYIINTTSNTVIGTIAATGGDALLAVAGAKLYIPQQQSDQITVVDTRTDTIIATISVPGFNSNGYNALVGTKLYYTKNNTDFFSIDTTTDTLIGSFSMTGLTPIYPILAGANLYVNNFGENTVSVIDPNSNTLLDTITVGISPYTSALNGTTLFVPNSGEATLSVVDTSRVVWVENIPVASGAV